MTNSNFNEQPKNAEQVNSTRTSSTNVLNVTNNELEKAEDLKIVLNNPTMSNREKFDILQAAYGLNESKGYHESYDEQTKILAKSLITPDTQLPPPITLLSIDDVSVIERGDIYLIKGKPKTGKTSATKALLTAALAGQCCSIKAKEKGLKVAYIDTEQKVQDTQLIMTNVMEQAPELSNDYIKKHFAIYGLRKRNYTTLPNDLLRIMVDNNPDILVVDGIADLVRSFNDEEASILIISLLTRIAEDFNCAVIGIIHENKSAEDHNAKGHLGSIATQKSALVIETTKKGEIIVVSCTQSRHKSMPDWFLYYNDDGKLCDGNIFHQQLRILEEEEIKKARNERMQERAEIMVQIVRDNGGSMDSTELKVKFKQQTGLKETMAKEVLSFAKKNLLQKIKGKICLA